MNSICALALAARLSFLTTNVGTEHALDRADVHASSFAGNDLRPELDLVFFLERHAALQSGHDYYDAFGVWELAVEWRTTRSGGGAQDERYRGRNARVVASECGAASAPARGVREFFRIP